ncbi:uncharacterized protein H6S33_006985 [Morchella sextelata]|uniref:uncharacterized protein n=1 Tax=Morchella sextelata TaxID=1174677 RepID=UPI001D0488E4|nr:uncharacterized protein H6S33_006985 [Morchella sextelata]KAH0603954.1 hypothetical protein H6S33_006985 [Morchella sextelata]
MESSKSSQNSLPNNILGINVSQTGVSFPPAVSFRQRGVLQDLTRYNYHETSDVFPAFASHHPQWSASAPAPSIPALAPVLVQQQKGVATPRFRNDAPRKFEGKTDTLRSGKWEQEERDLLLEWLGRNLANYEGFKMHVKSTCMKISVEVFQGSRTPEGIRGQWDLMKRKYHKAKERLNSTGEGQRDDKEKWASIKLSWLDKICPHYEQIDDILRRDRAVTPLFVSETGGDSNLEFVNGEKLNSFLSDNSEGEEIHWSASDTENPHPPAGGKKLPTLKESPLKKGETRGDGVKALKRKRGGAEDAIETIAQKRIDFEKTRLEFERERDERTFKLMEEREKNRHEETMARWRLMERKFDLKYKQSE